MPILQRESEQFPGDLLERFTEHSSADRRWWALYTLARREKSLMRALRQLRVASVCPILPRRQRSPSGRVRESFLPMFPSYVFVYGNEDERTRTLATNHVSRVIEVKYGEELVCDLRQICRLVASGAPLTPEAQLSAGDQVRVKSGSFKDYEGIVIRREKETRLWIGVRFLNQGASVLLDDCQVELLR